MSRKILCRGGFLFMIIGICLNFDIVKVFREERIVPEIIPYPPSNVVTVTYPTIGELVPGQNLTYNQTKDIPDVTWPCDPNKLYTLFLTGVCSWTPVKERKDINEMNVHGREWHQWIVINVPGNNLSAGETLYQYLLPGDPMDASTRDIYVFLIYEQKKKLEINKTVTDAEGWVEFQRSFRPYRFARRYRLGDPVAGNYYLVYYEGYQGQFDDDTWYG